MKIESACRPSVVVFKSSAFKEGDVIGRLKIEEAQLQSPDCTGLDFRRSLGSGRGPAGHSSPMSVGSFPEQRLVTEDCTGSLLIKWVGYLFFRHRRRIFRELKHRRRGRQRERQKTKVLISKTLALHVHYTLWFLWYISLPSSAKQRSEMTKFKVLWRTWTRDDKFPFPFLNFNAAPTTLAPG